jgi:adenylate cyclase
VKSIRKKHPFLFKTLSGCILGSAVFALILIVYLGGLFFGLEKKTQDFRFRLFAQGDTADPDIVIITIDEESLRFYREDLGTWPWPREVFGALIDYLADGGAAAIVFDMVFAEPDLEDRDSDSSLTDAAKRAGVVTLSAVFRPSPDLTGSDDYETLVQALYLKEHFSANVKNESDIHFFDYSSVTLPYLRLLSNVSLIGSINFVADPDGPSRSIYPVVVHRGNYYPSLPLAAALTASRMDISGATGTIDTDRILRMGAFEIPLTKDGRMPINWHGPYGTYRYYRIGDIIESMRALRNGESPPVPPGTFSGKIVLVGATAISLFDLRATPFSPVYPGVELNATAIDNIINRDHLRHAGGLVTLLFCFAFSVCFSPLSVRFEKPLFGILFFLFLLCVFSVLSAFLFVYKRIMIEYLAPIATLSLSFVSAVVFNYITEGRAKRKFRAAFAKYLSPDIVDEISKNLDDLKVDVGERKEVTILFSDIRGFTTMSEKLPPEEVVRLLNRYLDAMVKVIFNNGGTLDKYVGDAIMAFFGAPKEDPHHALTACRAALSMQDELARLNEELEKEGGPALSIGMGINTGEVVVGNIGSERRMDYTVIGDHVNLASRLEGLNKEFGTGIIISEFTRKKAGGIRTKSLGMVAIRGKEKKVRIFELIGIDESKT